MPIDKKQFGTGAIKDKIDIRDKIYDGIAMASEPFDWVKGYDIEAVIDNKLPFKNQDGSSSCVGQGWSYYLGVLDTIENGIYNEVSAKSVYSQIFVDGGGAQIRDGGKLAVNWGAVSEALVVSYDKGNPPNEEFMEETDWKSSFMDMTAKKLGAKEYRMILGITIETIAQGIRDNYGVVGGVNGANNGTWNTLEPKPTSKDWGHCLYFGKAGIDEKGKYIATPNSWGNRFNGEWQKLREEWFTEQYMFNPWLLIDRPNYMDLETQLLIEQMNKGMVIENEAPGRKGIIYGGKLLEVINGREGNAALYLIENKTLIRRITKTQFDAIPRGSTF